MNGILLFRRLANPWSSFFTSIPTSSVFCVALLAEISNSSSNRRMLRSSRSPAFRACNEETSFTPSKMLVVAAWTSARCALSRASMAFSARRSA
eukprot:CAMPEP_0176185890 /NCGR_PEP_ID=MMETSP0121_2-20121125/1587_1 /TAXON_ID=160619 /ORGANISM="Kryptoperidinium foliaceum, Strain CCMP 1326" /LENGTH=93 /DNA_ID=CAMNT_0017524357 /DNA_START=197 /DNA_END=474 /DNA_ORIENTATION=-